jgi:hypothetical protein
MWNLINEGITEWIFLYFFLGVIYLTLGNIPPLFRSTLNAIQLLAVATYPVIKEYGIDTLMEPIMNDLALIEQVHFFLIYVSITMIRQGVFSSVLQKVLLVNRLKWKSNPSYALVLCITLWGTSDVNRAIARHVYTL